METNGFSETQAIRVLKAAGQVVSFATEGGKISVPDEEELKRAIVIAHDNQDWDAYTEALRCWSNAALEVWEKHRRTSRFL